MRQDKWNLSDSGIAAGHAQAPSILPDQSPGGQQLLHPYGQALFHLPDPFQSSIPTSLHSPSTVPTTKYWAAVRSKLKMSANETAATACAVGFLVAVMATPWAV
jgi:hypothetical protein